MMKFVQDNDSDGDIHFTAFAEQIRVEIEEADKYYGCHPIKVFKDGVEAYILTKDELKKLNDRAHDDGYYAGYMTCFSLAFGKHSKKDGSVRFFGDEYINIKEHNKKICEEACSNWKEGFSYGIRKTKEDLFHYLSKIKED